MVTSGMPPSLFAESTASPTVVTPAAIRAVSDPVLLDLAWRWLHGRWRHLDLRRLLLELLVVHGLLDLDPSAIGLFGAASRGSNQLTVVGPLEPPSDRTASSQRVRVLVTVLQVFSWTTRSTAIGSHPARQNPQQGLCRHGPDPPRRTLPQTGLRIWGTARCA